ncbi:electron transport complex protein RnfG [Allopseudospirillum japonicum]|uniref:Ion-translocating oxidoreductase complex subunit G n=1 Tax=Allopseudospirillum japonicum TaxID=64971 RepID=A0A1H6QGY2_9GAMM|nr:electron transport complex subunit RsxG [Allopseudospirillum japonicum]SEI38242.1 electron transport complex protein RnfG [Allopseudospirillum japonicum]
MSSTETPNAQTLKEYIGKNALGLGIFAAITVGLIAMTYLGTGERIAANQAQAQAQALYQLAPETSYHIQLEARLALIPAALQGVILENPWFARARDKQHQDLLLLPMISKEGYSGDIRLLMAVDRQGVIQGVRVLGHKETPGLGDKIELKKSSWLLDFVGRSLLATPIWAVRKDGGEFDQFTGATITPRAVVKALYQSLDYLQKHPQIWPPINAIPEEANQ